MKFLRFLGIFLAVLMVILIALPFVINANQFRPQLEAGLSSALGRTFTIGNLSLSLFSGGVAAQASKFCR